MGTADKWVMTESPAPLTQLRLPILLAEQEGLTGAGVVAWLTLSRVPQGIGALYPDPLTLAWVTTDQRFTDALREAWSVAQSLYSGPAAAEQQIDIVWTLTHEDPRQPLPNLAGDSAGALLAVALAALLDAEHGVPLDPQVALTGRLTPDGQIGGVGGYDAKFEAAARQGLTVLVPAVDFPPDNLAAAQTRFPTLRIIPVATLAQARDQLSSLMGAYRTYLEHVCIQVARVPILERVPAVAELGVDFAVIHQPVRVSRRRLRYSAEEAARLESLRRAGDLEAADALRLYDWHGEQHYEEQAGGQLRGEPWATIRDEVERGVLLGDPGMGKTVLLKLEAGCLAAGELARLARGELRLDQAAIPILLRCETLAQHLARRERAQRRAGEAVPDGELLSQALVSALQQECRSLRLPVPFWAWMHHQFVAALAADGTGASTARCQVLLDGLDEVQRHRSLLVQALRGVPAQTPGLRLLLTSRLVGYSGSPVALDGGRQQQEFELLTLTPDDVDHFIAGWFQRDPARGYRLKTRLSLGPGGAALAGLARIPLMLAFLCLLASEERPIPTQRGQLYQAILDLLLGAPHRAAPADLPETASETLVEQQLLVLEQLAWELAHGGEQWRDGLPRRALVPLLQRLPEVAALAAQLPHRHGVLWQLSEQAGVLTRLGAGEQAPYAFIHRSLQEFLVARALARPGVDWRSIVAAHRAFASDWVEPISLLAGLLTPPSALLQLLRGTPNDAFHEALLLAGRCLAETTAVQHLDSSLEQALLVDLIALLRSRSWLDRQRAQQLLVRIGPRVLRFTPPAFFLDATVDLRLRAGMSRVLGGIGGRQAGETLVAVLAAPDAPRDILSDVVWALGQIGGSEATRALLDVLLDIQVDDTLRAYAAEALANIGTGQAERDFEQAADAAIAALIEVLQTTDQPYLAHQVARRLGEIGGDRATDALLEVLVDPERDPITRAYAFESLPRRAHGLDEQEIERQRESVEAQLLARLWDEEVDETTRYEAAGAIGAVGGAAAVDELRSVVALTQDELVDPTLAGSAMMALGEIGGPEAVAILVAVLAGPGLIFDIAYEWAADALGMIGDDTAIRALEGVVRDDEHDPAARVQAARVLGLIGRELAVEPLEAALQDPEADAAVLLRTLQALSGVRTEAATRAIERALTQAIEPLVRGQALATVGAYRPVNRATILAVAGALIDYPVDEQDVERYELLWRLAPLIHDVARTDWPAWQARLALLTGRMLEPRDEAGDDSSPVD